MSERIDIDTPYDLSPQQLQDYKNDGYVKLENVFNEETLETFGTVITSQTIALNEDHRPIESRSTYDRAFLQVMNLWEQNTRVCEFVFGRKLAKIAADIMGVSGVRLYHDQSLYKEPSGGITPAHADQYYWPLSSDRTVTAWIPLQTVTADMGPLGFYKGSQSVEFGRSLEISDESEALITERMERGGFAYDVEPFDLGTVSFHSGWTFHKAGPNLSGKPRSVMTVIFMDENITLKSPTNTKQMNDWEKWCPGAIVGKVIETQKNPVLFSYQNN